MGTWACASRPRGPGGGEAGGWRDRSRRVVDVAPVRILSPDVLAKGVAAEDRVVLDGPARGAAWEQDADMYVYDLSMEDDATPHFQAGVGRLQLHNTDSIMVTLADVHTPEDAFTAGEELSLEVTTQLADPDEDATGRDPTKKKPRLVFEMEKVLYPSVFWKKKRYGGVKHVRNKVGDVVSVGTMLSGTVVGRRDVCPAVQGLYQQMMDALLHQKSREECLRLFHAHMGALVRGQYMLEQMVITKGVREAKKQDNLAQLRVVEKQRQRAPGSETLPGNRLKMVYVEGDRKAQRNDLAEDYEYAKAHGLRIDVPSYIDAQYRTPCESILSLFCDNAEGMLDAYVKEHTRFRGGPMDRFLSAKKAEGSASADAGGGGGGAAGKKEEDGKARARVEMEATRCAEAKERRKRKPAGGKAAAGAGGMGKWMKKEAPG